MTSKEIEERSGVPRANIRYYEAEGLLTPHREKNGYRDYSDADLALLEKIRLLRRLGVPVEEVRALCRGQGLLIQSLDKRIAALREERGTLERVSQVCDELRAQAADFATLDAARYLQTLDETDTAPNLPAADALPGVYQPVRRLFARLFDWYILLMAVLAVLSLLGYNPARANNLALNLGITALIVLLEPLALRLFGTTPGKALLGMSLSAPDGSRLSYGAGFLRVVQLFWYGLGACIPIWNLVQLYRSAKRCADGEPQPWDAEVAYSGRPCRFRQIIAFTAAAIVVTLGAECINCACQLPPNRGELTVAEFAENFNRQANYLGMEYAEYLDENGQWQEKDTDGCSVAIQVGSDWPESREFQYTVEDGNLTAVTMTARCENVESWLTLPTEQMMMAVTAFTWAQKQVPFFPKARQALLTEMAESGTDGFHLSQGGTSVTLEVESGGFYESTLDGMLFAQEGMQNFCEFTFTVALDS